MKNKYIKILIVVAAFLFLGAVTSVSYSYFTATVGGNNISNETVITSGQMALSLIDGEQVGLENALPGASVTKKFKVKNTGTVVTNYDIYLSEIINTFADKKDLVYTLTSAIGCPNATETIVPSKSGEQSKIVSSCPINPNIEHEYVLTIKFNDDGTNQDDNKGKKFSAKISINEFQESKISLIETIQDLKKSSSIDLEYDETEDNNLRYVGANPNNFVEFNNELWRIIGVMNNIETSSGQMKSLLKIRRTESLGNYSWDSSSRTGNYNGGSGINQWGPSGTYEGADLMRELNTDYLGNVTVGISGTWYSNVDNGQIDVKPSSTINQSSQEMIETVVWNLGSPSNDNGTFYESSGGNIMADVLYTRERASTNGKICTSGIFCDDEVTRTSSWMGKVGLIYPSDYSFSTSGGSMTTRETCLSTSMFDWDDSGVSDCKNNSWIYNSSLYQWTLSPYAFSSNANLVLSVGSNGGTVVNMACTTYSIFPVVFLKSNVNVTDGDGTQDNPYKLTM